MSISTITTIGNRIHTNVLGRHRETGADRQAPRAEVLELRGRAANEAMRLRAVA